MIVPPATDSICVIASNPLSNELIGSYCRQAPVEAVSKKDEQRARSVRSLLHYSTVQIDSFSLTIKLASFVHVYLSVVLHFYRHVTSTNEFKLFYARPG